MRTLELLCNLGRLLVAVLCGVNDCLFRFTALVFTQVPIIVTLHFVVEYNVLRVVRASDKMLIDQVQHVVAVFRQLFLDLQLVVADGRQVFVTLKSGQVHRVTYLQLFFVLDGYDRSPGGAPLRNRILVSQ